MSDERARRGGGGIKNPYVRFQKLTRPPLTLFPTTLWDYPSQHYGKGTQGSQGYRGATPSFVIWQVLERYTRPGDVVVDPFCGSGTSLDVCRDLGRRGRGFDLAPFRDDIERADARALPLDDASVDHAFLDPPYADNLVYSDDPACIGRLPADGRYQDAMRAVRDELVRVVRPGGVVAVFVSDVKKATSFHALGAELFHLFAEVMTPVDHVVVVRHGRKVEDARAQRHGRFGPALQRGFSHLLLFERAAGPARRASSSSAPPPGRPVGPRDAPREGPRARPSLPLKPRGAGANEGPRDDRPPGGRSSGTKRGGKRGTRPGGKRSPR